MFGSRAKDIRLLTAENGGEQRHDCENRSGRET
jgi:hypothetical protein